MTLRLSALLVWTLAAAAAVFWGLRLLVPAAPLPERTQMASLAPPVTGDLSRLLGAAPVAMAEVAAPPPEAASRFRLTGVVATRSDRDPQGPAAPGLALISVDGSPPRAYRVGDALDPGFRLASVGLRSARVGTAAGTASFLLELPPPTPAATGVPAAYSAVPGGPMVPGSVMPSPPMPMPMPGQGQMLPVGVVPDMPPPVEDDPSGRNRMLTQ